MDPAAIAEVATDSLYSRAATLKKRTFSDFIRNAPEDERRRVYEEVLILANQKQSAIPAATTSSFS